MKNPTVDAPSKTLSKFFTFNENSLQALSEPYFWFSRPEDFNDPFESKVSIIYPDNVWKCIEAFDALAARSTQEDWRERSAAARETAQTDPNYVLEQLRPRLEEIETFSFEKVRKASMCCFFNEQDNKKDDLNILMWAHYGNGLKGFKVEFESQILIDTLPKEIAMLPVAYSKKFPTVKMLDLVNAYARSDISGAALLLVAHIGTKHSAWKYEKEYRFISDTRGEHKYDAKAIKTVTFGEKMPEAQRKVIAAVTRSINPNIHYYEAKRSSDSYQLIKTPLTL